MATPLMKDEAHKLVDQMPEGSTWEDLIYKIYVRQAVERGLADSREGRTSDVQEVRARYGPSV